jgi:hypothetical protein
VSNVQPQILVENYTIMDVMEKMTNNYNIQKEFSIITKNLYMQWETHMAEEEKRHHRGSNSRAEAYIS